MQLIRLFAWSIPVGEWDKATLLAAAVVIRSVKAVDPEGDGTYTFSLGQLPTGRYKLRVNHADYKAAFYGGANLNKATAFVLENPGDEFVAGHFELVPKP